jgi:S1-C subfamily serine protease
MWVTVGSEDGTDLSVRVEGERFLIGTGDESQMKLGDPNVAPLHAYFERRPDGKVFLHALEGETRVDGQKVEGPTEIHGNEVVQLGDTTLTTSVDDPAEEARELRETTGEHEEHAAAVRVTTEGQTVEVVPADEEDGEPGGVRVTTEGEAVEVVPVGEHRRLRHRIEFNTALAGAAVLLALAGLLTYLLTRDNSPSTAEVVADATPRTVLVRALAGSRGGSGSGFVLDAGRGLVVTNFHVVNQGTSFQVGVADQLRAAKIVGAAPCDDLAVLSVETHDGMKTMPLGSQAELDQGDDVVAVGFPANASQDDNLTSTAGVVSVVKSSFRFPTPDSPSYSNVVQTDAALSPGNSGGPLIDSSKELVGVNTAILTSIGKEPIQGQGYAIGVDRVKEVTDVLRGGKSQGWAGFGLAFPTKAERARLRLPEGVVATPAVPGTPAENAGFRGGGLLVSINGTKLDSTLQSYCDAVRSVESGKTATVEVITKAGGKSRQMAVKFL